MAARAFAKPRRASFARNHRLRRFRALVRGDPDLFERLRERRTFIQASLRDVGGLSPSVEHRLVADRRLAARFTPSAMATTRAGCLRSEWRRGRPRSWPLA